MDPHLPEPRPGQDRAGLLRDERRDLLEKDAELVLLLARVRGARLGRRRVAELGQFD